MLFTGAVVALIYFDKEQQTKELAVSNIVMSNNNMNDISPPLGENDLLSENICTVTSVDTFMIRLQGPFREELVLNLCNLNE